ncbi:MAG TPA: hypothetical protein VLG10_05270, partial [Methylomirabilota bacterium]|nr:hypothetical protein [Methylomirabilota bacterium]
MLLALSAPGARLAHQTHLATGEVHISGDLVAYRLRVSGHDLAVALGVETDLVTPVPAAVFESRRATLEHYLAARLAVTSGDAPCVADSPLLDDADQPEDLVLVLRYHCPEAVARLSIHYDLFFDLDPGHRSVGRVLLRGGDEPFVFDHSHRRLDVDVRAART